MSATAGPEEVEFLVCNECETPCYMFEMDKKGGIVSAYCGSCGSDKPEDFRVPEYEGDE